MSQMYEPEEEQAAAGNNEVQMNELLQACVDEGASDLHIQVGVPPVLRMTGRMQHLDTAPLVPEDTLSGRCMPPKYRNPSACSI